MAATRISLDIEAHSLSFLRKNPTVKFEPPTTPKIRSYDSLPENELKQPLVRLGPHLLITPDVEYKDQMNLLDKIKQAKAAKLKALETKLQTKLISIGNVKQGTPIPNICNDSAHLLTQTILQSIRSPIEWQHHGKKIRQKISDACTTRTDVIALKEKLDKINHEFGLKEMGLRERQELYSQCFDEIIRQVSVSCAERGQLLLSLRDEINLTFLAYESLFSSAIALGIRRQLRHEQNVNKWQIKLDTVTKEILDITNTHQEFIPTFQALEAKFVSQMEADTKDYEAEYDRLIKNNRVLKNLLLNSAK